MNLLGQKIKHKAYGVGTVVNMDDDSHVTIEFASKTSTFQYPQAFEMFLTAEDDKVQTGVMNDLQAMKDAIAAEKAAKAAAAEEAARLARESQPKKKGTSEDKKFVPVSREDGKALTFLVFQGGTFKEEAEGQFLWAPKVSASGGTCFHWDNMMNVREGDVILHCADGYIKAVSRAKGSFIECNRPIQYADNVDGLWSKDGRKIECEYTLIEKPIKHSDYHDDIIEYCRVKYAPFDKDGNGNMGYLYDLDSRLASIFLQATVEKNPEIKDLDYIQWLL